MMALTLLTAYLLSIAGTAAMAIGCDCPHSFYRDHSHSRIGLCCQHHCCHAHHAEADRHDRSPQLTADSECCRHNHSTEIALYTAGNDDATTLRMAVAWSDAAPCDSDIQSVVPTAVDNLHAERPCPPGQKCLTRCRSLRAPPVCA